MGEKVIVETGEIINLGAIQTHQEDPYSLCASKHEVAIGTTVNAQGLKPFDDYIIVYFHPYDTSGGGKLMEWLGEGIAWVMEKGKATIQVFTDVGEGMAQNSRDRGVVYGEGLEGGFAKGYKETVDSVGRGAKQVACLGGWNPLCAETDYSLYAEQSSPFYTPKGFEAESKQFALENAATSCGNDIMDEWAALTGGCHHSLAGNYHKVRITLKCTYEGVTTTKYNSDLAGCPAQYEDPSWCANGETYKRFLINSPGTWTVEVKPISTNTCASLNYQDSATYEVAKPEGWTPSAITTLSTTISTQLQNAGIPVAITPLHIVGIGSLLGGIMMLKLFKKKNE